MGRALTQKDLDFENEPLWVRQRINGKLEPVSSYNYFQEFLNLPKPRTLVNLKKVLENKKDFDSKPSGNTLAKYSANWGWFARALEYDEYVQQKRLERTIEVNNKLIDERNKWILEHTKDLKDRLEFSNRIKKTIEDEEGEFLEEEIAILNTLNKIILDNNKSYNEISDKLLKIYKEEDDKNKINIVNNNTNNNVPMNDFVKQLDDLLNNDDDDEC